MIKDLLKDKSAIEKNDIKIKEIVKNKVKNFQLKDFEVDVIELSQEGNRLRVAISAKKNGNEITVNNPLYFINPPILIPDGTKKTVVNEKGIEQKIDNFKEDIDQALKEMIIDTLRIIAK